MDTICQAIRKDLDSLLITTPQLSRTDRGKQNYARRKNRKTIDPVFATNDNERLHKNYLLRQERKRKLLFPYLADAEARKLDLNFDEDTVNRCFHLYKDSLMIPGMFCLFYIFYFHSIIFSQQFCVVCPEQTMS